MSGDPGSDPTFTGVKQPSFDNLVSKHSSSGSQLESLASCLWAELSKAGLDTSPALRIREIAKRVSAQAEDLRRRQRLVHEMVRQKTEFGIGFCTPQGTYHPVPDRITDLMTKLDGRAAADLAKRAGKGDHNALAGLKKYASYAHNPHFAQAFLQALQPKGMVELPASLAKQIRAALNESDPRKAKALSVDAKQALGIMSSALAAGTNPQSPGYIGDSFLNGLKAQARGSYKDGGLSYSGYQSLALVWRMHQGSHPYSPHFMKTVGGDAIAFEKERLSSTWPPDVGALARRPPGVDRQVGMADLAAVYGLNGDLRQAKRFPPERSSIVDDAFHAVGADKQAAQALLDGQLAGMKQTALTYLLTTRLGAFHDTKDYRSFQIALQAALSGPDATSMRLTGEALVALKGQVAGCFGEKDGRLVISDPKKLDLLGFLRRPIGVAMATNINNVFDVYEKKAPAFKSLTTGDMDKLLIFATRDGGAFKMLVGAHSERLRRQVDSTNEKQMLEVVLPEARLFGHLLEARKLAISAEYKDKEEAKKQAAAMVAGAMEAVTSSWGKAVSEISAPVEKLTSTSSSAAYGKLSTWIVDQMFKHGLSAKDAAQGPKGDREMVASLIGDTIIAAKIAKGKWTPRQLESMNGQPFATNGNPPKLKPLGKLSPAEFDKLIEWTRQHTNIESTRQQAKEAMDNSAKVDVHANIGID